MRAETRHSLKQDRFSKATMEAAEKTVHWTVEHRSKLTYVGGSIVVIAALSLGSWYYVNRQDESASVELTAAIRTMDTPVRPPGVPPQPGFESFASGQERATAAHKQFQAIADKYPRTRTADMARYFVGLSAAELGDNAAAERSLQQAANVSDKELAALGKFALASLFGAERKDAQAIDLYKQLIDRPTSTVSKVTAQLELAQLYESRQKPDQAKRIYDQVQKENPGTEAASLAQRRASQIKQ